jgi:hypothetical protein
MRSKRIYTALIFTVVAVWLVTGCTKSITSTDRYAVTKLHPGAAVLFLLDSQSYEKSSKMEARIVRTMFRALDEANANVRVLGSKEFCPDVTEPFYTPDDITLLLQDAHFRERLQAAQVQYIVLVYVMGSEGDWSTRTHSDPGGMAVYNRRESGHHTRATVMDDENTEVAGALMVDCSSTAGYGIGFGASNGLCCIFPFAWYGGPTEDLAIRTLAANVAKFLTDKDATPNAKHPE